MGQLAGEEEHHIFSYTDWHFEFSHFGWCSDPG